VAEVLSQAEIDALLSALHSGEVSAEDIRGSAQTSKVRNYDFRRAMRFSKDHIRIISRIHDHFCRLLTTHLSGQLRSMVQLQVETVDQVPYEEFIRSVPHLTVIQVMEFSPLDGKVVVEMNPQIVFAMLDRLMGGFGRGPYRERELTEIEQSLFSRLISGVPDFFAEAWKNVAELRPRLVSMESNPQFLQLTTPNETVLVVTISAKVGEATGLFNVCIPHVTVEPIMSRLSTQYFMDVSKTSKLSDARQAALGQHVRNVSVDVHVRLGTTQLALQELLDLQIGDVIPLDTRIRDPLTVFVDGVPAYVCNPGRSGQRMAVKILDEYEGGSSDGGPDETVPG
jgi:flagellar motor switch protein FliM